MSGRGRIYQRGAICWIEYWFRGRQHRESSGSRDEADARRLLRRRLKELGAAELGLTRFVGPGQERLLVGELLDALEADYQLRKVRACAQARAHLRPIREAFGDWRAVAVTEEAIDRYITERLAQGKRPATVNRETQLLGQAFRLGMERHRLSGMPRIRRLSESDNVRQGFFEPRDVEAVVAALPEALGDVVRFAYLTGWRRGEIAGLTWADVDRERTMLRLRPEASKNRHGRAVALEGALAVVIERRWLARLFVDSAGAVRVADRVFHRDGRAVGDFRRAWAKACRAAGLEGRLFHDLRRSAVRNMVRAGVSETVAMKVSGHRTRSMFDRYNITSTRDLREAMRKVEAYVNKPAFPEAPEGEGR